MEEREVVKALEKLRNSILQSPTRLAIMMLLAYRNEMEFNELQKVLGIAPGSLWSHLNKLKSSGYVSFKRKITVRGPRLVISITLEGYRELMEYLRTMRYLIDRFGDLSMVEETETRR